MKDSRLTANKSLQPTSSSSLRSSAAAAELNRYASGALSMIWRLISLCSLLIAGDVCAQEQSLEEFCSANPCRKSVPIKLRTDGKPIDQTLSLYWPALQGDRISVLPGETVFVEVRADGNTITLLRQVTENTNPDSTLKFEFTQMEEDIGMTLSVHNPFKAQLKYHINMIDFRGNPHQTSSCPAIAGGGAYESWPHPIPELIISDLHLLPDSNQMACVY